MSVQFDLEIYEFISMIVVLQQICTVCYLNIEIVVWINQWSQVAEGSGPKDTARIKFQSTHSAQITQIK
jgi:hypothetical protein